MDSTWRQEWAREWIELGEREGDWVEVVSGLTLGEHVATRGAVEIRGVGVTGSGRYLTGHYIGADVIRNEITAQARAAAAIDPDVDTIIEIGGQDSKYIRMHRGAVVDFTMNNACAAGTGSFLEEQADGLGVSIFDEFAALAFESGAPRDLGSKCTVFMEAELRRAQQEGTPLPDICAGLAYSVARNYLEKVVAGREIGEHVVFQGGTASNASVVAALSSLLGRPVQVHPHNRVSGAIGMALIAARERQQQGFETAFRGLGACEGHSTKSFECKKCENRCRVSRIRVGERRVHFGDACERYAEKDAGATAHERPFPELFLEREELGVGQLALRDQRSLVHLDDQAGGEVPGNHDHPLPDGRQVGRVSQPHQSVEKTDLNVLQVRDPVQDHGVVRTAPHGLELQHAEVERPGGRQAEIPDVADRALHHLVIFQHQELGLEDPCLHTPQTLLGIGLDLEDALAGPFPCFVEAGDLFFHLVGIHHPMGNHRHSPVEDVDRPAADPLGSTDGVQHDGHV